MPLSFLHLLLTRIIEFTVDVQDIALLHVGGLLLPGVQNERLFGFANRMNTNTQLAVLRKVFPEKSFAEDLPGLMLDKSTISTESALEVLKKMGRDGWTSEEESWTNMKDLFLSPDFDKLPTPDATKGF